VAKLTQQNDDTPATVLMTHTPKKMRAAPFLKPKSGNKRFQPVFRGEMSCVMCGVVVCDDEHSAEKSVKHVV